MKSILRRRPSPALVISCIALFVSLGGVSYGVATGFIDSREIKNNEIRSADLRNNQIRTFDIRNNEVRGFDIRNSSVQGRDVALNTLTGADIAEGELGKVPSATAADTAGSADVGGRRDAARCSPTTAQAGSGFVDGPRRWAGSRWRRLRRRTGVMVVQANPQVGNGELSATWGGGGAVGRHHGPRSGGRLSDRQQLRERVRHDAVYAGSDGRTVIVQAVAREQLHDVRGTANDCGLFGGGAGRDAGGTLRSGCDLDDNGP